MASRAVTTPFGLQNEGLCARRSDYKYFYVHSGMFPE